MLPIYEYNGTLAGNLLEDTDVINALTSSDTTKPLSAAQGKALVNKFNEIKINSMNNVLIISGTITLNIKGNAYAILFTGDQIKQMLGLSSYDFKKVVAVVTNANASLLGDKIDATYMSTDGSLSITLNKAAAGNFDISYAIIYNLD